MYKFKLYLYMSGETPPSVVSAYNLSVLLDKEIKGQYSLEVINVLDDPQRAQEDNILATPTLVKASPLPEKRVVGDLSDKEKVLTALGLTAEKEIREVAQ
jgi:circadian clock protein KaiB